MILIAMFLEFNVSEFAKFSHLSNVGLMVLSYLNAYNVIVHCFLGQLIKLMIFCSTLLLHFFGILSMHFEIFRDHRGGHSVDKKLRLT